MKCTQDNVTLLFFPDFSPATTIRRKAFNPVLKKMTALGLQPFLTYPVANKLRHMKKCESKAYISAIKSLDDQVTTNPVAINDIFKGFYTNLYKADTDFDEPICKQYLDKLELPRISQMDKESLEAPLSMEELHVSLKSLQNCKSLGLDGLPPELYLEIWDLVGTLMLNSFNFAIEQGVFHRDQKTSLISLLLKKGKDTLDCSSYRPISLIPCDLKIYAKVFASRMEKVIHSLIK